MERLAGRSAVVTGAANGIGRAIAFAFAAEGARVCMLDINGDLLKEAAGMMSGTDLHPVVCDIADRDAVLNAVDGFAAGRLDILVNNAVAFHYAPLVKFPPEQIHRMIDIGLKGVFWALQAATPHLLRSSQASVLNLSSIAVSTAIHNAAVYSSIKGAIDTLTRQQAEELGPYGVRVNALAPGSVKTPGASSVIDEEGWRQREAKTLLRRLPTVEDIAAAAVFLSSEEARCITGVTLKVDAGMTVPI